MEPFRLRCWKIQLTNGEVVFFTCARPGRSKGSQGKVHDFVVDQWVSGLPGDRTATVISLLGRKHGVTGMSEFAFYSFCSEFDTTNERGNRQTFQNWLEKHHPDRFIQVIEIPTFDLQPIDAKTLDVIMDTLKHLTYLGRTVILMDSGGMTRVESVCNKLGAKEDTTSVGIR